MDISQRIQAVYQRALHLRQAALESPVSPLLLETALDELYFVLEELQTSQEELQQQNQALFATRHIVELERQRYQALFELAPNGYLLTDLKANIRQANHYAASQLFCLPREYLINKPLLVLVHEADRAYFQNQLTSLMSSKTWEMRLRTHPQNNLVFAAVSVIRIRDPRLQIDMLLWSINDITHRKQMQQKLKMAYEHLEITVLERTAELIAANAKLKQEASEHQQAEENRDQAAMTEMITDAIFIQDLEQQITFWNQGAECLYGWDTTDILGQSAALVFPIDDPALATGIKQTLKQGTWQTRLNQVTRLGDLIQVESRWTLMQDKLGQPQSILVINTKITENR